ncbi:hypothetical protein OAK97_02715, partial [bacterium]|nr:hypothetical protein [bacterium]
RGGQTVSGVFDSHPLRHWYLVLKELLTELERGFGSLENGRFRTIRPLSVQNPFNILTLFSQYPFDGAFNSVK